MRTEAEVHKLVEIAKQQTSLSRAADLWRGMEDAANWILGQENPVIDIWIEISSPSIIDVELLEVIDGS